MYKNNHIQPISCHDNPLCIVFGDFSGSLSRYVHKNASELRSQAIPEFLSEDFPSRRSRYLVCEDHFPNLFVWSNLPEKIKGLKCENHSNSNRHYDIDSIIVCLIEKNLLSNVIDHML